MGDDYSDAMRLATAPRKAAKTVSKPVMLGSHSLCWRTEGALKCIISTAKTNDATRGFVLDRRVVRITA